MSSWRFSVDEAMLEAWASQRSVRPTLERPEDDTPKGWGWNLQVDFRGRRRPNQLDLPVTDAEARLWQEGRRVEARLSHLEHVLGENRQGPFVNIRVTKPYWHAEQEAEVESA